MKNEKEFNDSKTGEIGPRQHPLCYSEPGLLFMALKLKKNILLVVAIIATVYFTLIRYFEFNYHTLLIWNYFTVAYRLLSYQSFMILLISKALLKFVVVSASAIY